MKSSLRFICFSLLLCLASAAQGGDVADVTSAVDRALEAVSSTDPDDTRAVMLAEAGLFALRPDPENPDAPMSLRIRSREEQLALISPDDPEFIERWLEPARVSVHGPIASVWGTYEFLIDGRVEVLQFSSNT